MSAGSSSREAWAEYGMTRCIALHLISEIGTWTARKLVPSEITPVDTLTLIQAGINVTLFFLFMCIMLQHKICALFPSLQRESCWHPTLSPYNARSFRLSAEGTERTLGSVFPIVLTLIFLTGTLVGDLLIIFVDHRDKITLVLICQVPLDACGYLMQLLYWVTEPDHTRYSVEDDPLLRVLMKSCGILYIVFFFAIQAVKVPRFFFAEGSESPWERTQDFMESFLIFSLLYLSLSFWHSLGPSDLRCCETVWWFLRCCPRGFNPEARPEPDEAVPLLYHAPVHIQPFVPPAVTASPRTADAVVEPAPRWDTTSLTYSSPYYSPLASTSSASSHL
jgi:hypothetical protein